MGGWCDTLDALSHFPGLVISLKPGVVRTKNWTTMAKRRGRVVARAASGGVEGAEEGGAWEGLTEAPLGRRFESGYR